MPPSIQILIIAIELTHTEEEQTFAVADKVHDHPRISAIRTENKAEFSNNNALIKLLTKMSESIQSLEKNNNNRGRNDIQNRDRFKCRTRTPSKSRDGKFRPTVPV